MAETIFKNKLEITGMGICIQIYLVVFTGVQCIGATLTVIVCNVNWGTFRWPFDDMGGSFWWDHQINVELFRRLNYFIISDGNSEGKHIHSRWKDDLKVQGTVITTSWRVIKRRNSISIRMLATQWRNFTLLLHIINAAERQENMLTCNYRISYMYTKILL